LLARDVGKLADFVRSEAHRLLDHDVPTRTERPLRQSSMRSLRCGDIDDIDRRITE